MIFVYFPLILLSILGYGFFASEKIIKLRKINLGFQGIIGFFFLLVISYLSTQFVAHSIKFNSSILLIGLIFFIIYFNKLNLDKKNIRLLAIITFLSLIFILVGKKS